MPSVTVQLFCSEIWPCGTKTPLCQGQSSIHLSITSGLLHLCAGIMALISQFRTTPTESCPICNYDVFTCSRLSIQNTHPFIGSYMLSKPTPHDYSPKYLCSLGSTYDHVPRLCDTPLHSSSHTLILSDKLL